LLKSEIVLLRRILESRSGMLEIPSDSSPDFIDDLRQLVRDGFVECKTEPKNFPGKDLYALTHAGKEAIEACNDQVKKCADDKKHDTRLAILSAFCGALFVFLFDRIPQIVSFFRSLLHR